MSESIASIKPGSRGEVTGYTSGSAAWRDRLLAMGLTRGTSFTVLRVAPLGDPVEIEVRGFKLSLRKTEADALEVRRL